MARLVLEPLARPSAAQKRELAQVTGRALALFSWLGLADLHWENLALGVGPDGEMVFAPLDVEMILADLAMPTETKLLPDADPEVAAVCQHACGVRRVLAYLGKPVPVELVVTIAAAYGATLALLDASAAAIAAVFAGLPHLHEAPIRVLLRGTGDYVQARDHAVWPPLLPAEVEQLARGDIPYFFRCYGRPGIRYYADAALKEVARLPTKGDVPRLEPLLSLSRGLRSPSRKALREAGLFTVLGAFDHPAFSGRHRADGLEVAFRRRTLAVRVEGVAAGDPLETVRALSAFVGSVYQPCRCGEVRAVLVPATTRCRARG